MLSLERSCQREFECPTIRKYVHLGKCFVEGNFSLALGKPPFKTLVNLFARVAIDVQPPKVQRGIPGDTGLNLAVDEREHRIHELCCKWRHDGCPEKVVEHSEEFFPPLREVARNRRQLFQREKYD